MAKIKTREIWKKITDPKHVFIIAEAGVNHNGDFSLAKKLVDAAKRAGADAVKFQSFRSEDLVTMNAEMAHYQKLNLKSGRRMFEMLKKIELSTKQFYSLKRYCDRKRIIFLSTPHTENFVDILYPLISLYKVGSGDLTNIPMLEKIAKKRKPMIVGTGMSDLDEIREAVSAIKRCGNNKIVLLHCTSNYPCPAEEANLNAMITIKKKFNLPVGYSDHTVGIEAAVISTALGAVVIEKHFTLSNKLRGPDHQASLNPAELAQMIRSIRLTEAMLGNAEKQATKNEAINGRVGRKSIVAAVAIPKGAIINKMMLAIKRPGTGIKPKFLPEICGQRAKKNIKQDTIVSWRDLTE